jgi:hypothetical protein
MRMLDLADWAGQLAAAADMEGVREGRPLLIVGLRHNDGVF